jgi:TetR/AcrR family transcriptional regulator, regulator of biofilm formation and stress response
MTVVTRPRGAARRDALLDAVIQIVAQFGVDGVTHRRVADVAGLPLASTTYWFASKEEMLTAALEAAAERDLAWLQAVADELEGTDDVPGAIVALLYDPIEEQLRNSRSSLLGAYALLLEAARRPALREIASRWTNGYITTTAHLLELGGSQDPIDDARVVVGAIDGLIMQQLAEGRTTSLRAAVNRLVTRLVASP